jgi:hypothetical protein
MKRRITITIVAALLTAMLVPTAFGKPTANGSFDPWLVNLLARNQSRASSAARPHDFYVSSKYGQPDPWILNLIARKGYRQLPSHS